MGDPQARVFGRCESAPTHDVQAEAQILTPRSKLRFAKSLSFNGTNTKSETSSERHQSLQKGSSFTRSETSDESAGTSRGRISPSPLMEMRNSMTWFQSRSFAL